jgi:hypothetical protein
MRHLEANDPYSPHALQRMVKKGEMARQPAPELPGRTAAPREMTAAQSTPLPAPVSDYKRPDEFERGADIITLLQEAEERARLPQRDMHIQGTGDGKGNTLYFGGNLGDRALNEDEVYQYLADLDAYSRGEGHY